MKNEDLDRTRRDWRWLAAAVLFTIACGKGGAKPAPAGDSKDPAAAPTGDAAAATPSTDKAAPVPTKPWVLRTASLDLVCGIDRPTGETYKDQMAEGRAASKAKKWGLAIAAFEAALTSQDGDAAALSELSWAALQAGDLAYALDTAERSATTATDPRLQAASHYNAGRAAEALGDLERARSHYEQSTALKPNPAITERLAKLGPPPAPKPLGAAATLTICQKLPSIDAVCSCLTGSVASWTEEFAAASSCTPADQKGTTAQLVTVVSAPAKETLGAGNAVVLIAHGTAGWSAVRVVASGAETNLEETPNGGSSATILAYEERPVAGGTLIWGQTRSGFSESANRQESSMGSAAVFICKVADSGVTSCQASISLGHWQYTYDGSTDDGTCDVRELSVYGASLDEKGRLSVFRVAGSDDGHAGRYAL